MDEVMKTLIPPGVSEEWLNGYRDEIQRQERERCAKAMVNWLSAAAVLTPELAAEAVREILNPDCPCKWHEA